MVRTRVGYAGGTSEAPTYESIGDHAEAIEIDFDPGVISYGELLEMFFAGSHAYRAYPGGQYRSAIWTRDEAQADEAGQAARRFAEARGEEVHSEISGFTGFTLAEDYHQKYLLRRHGEVLGEFVAMYPGRDAFLASTAVTRANAFFGRDADANRLAEDLPRMGLSEGASRSLRES